MIFTSAILLTCTVILQGPLDCDVDIVALNGHETAVMGVEFSPDGRDLASCGRDGAVKIWDVNSAKLKSLLDESEFWARKVQYSPDGSMLATSYGDGMISLWNVPAYTKSIDLVGHKDDVNNIKFSPNGRTLASISPDQTVRIWDVASGRETQVFDYDSSEAYLVEFSPDGTLLAVSGLAGIRLWKISTGVTLLSTRGFEVCTAFSPDGALLAYTDENQAVVLWDVRHSRKLKTLTGHAAPINNIVFSADGSHLFTTDRYKTAKAWSLQDGRQVTFFSMVDTLVLPGSIGVSSDGILFLAFTNGDVRQLSSAPPFDGGCRFSVQAAPFCLDVSLKNDCLAVGSSEGTLSIIRRK